MKKRLVERAKQHDKEAFVELMERHKMDMYKVARSYFSAEEDIADVMQDTVLSCYEKLDTLREVRYFKTWLIRILINRCNDLYKKRSIEYCVDSFPELADTNYDKENVEFEELMNTLDERYRIVLMLYYAEGFNTREISEILELSENTVRTRLARGRKQYAKECGMEYAGQHT